MCFVTFYVNSGERPYRADIFAGAATDAGSFVDGGNVGRHIVVGIGGHHLDCAYGTMTLAVATRSLTLCRDALTDHDDGMTKLYARLIDGIEGLDGSCRTHL